MAPEQASGEAIDGRADIYALGIILFEMLTGKQPYEADTPMGVAIKHIMEPVPHILDINPDLPPEIDEIIQNAMVKDRNKRFATAVEMTSALKALSQVDASERKSKSPPTVKAPDSQPSIIAQRKRFNPYIAIVPVVVIAVGSRDFFLPQYC